MRCGRSVADPPVNPVVVEATGVAAASRPKQQANDLSADERSCGTCFERNLPPSKTMG